MTLRNNTNKNSHTLNENLNRRLRSAFKKTNYTKMKKIIYYFALIALMVSCSQNSDKKAQLEKLKVDYEKLSLQIQQLESELNVKGENIERKSIPVSVVDANECIFDHYIQVQGTVDGEQNIAVSPQMAGIVTAVYVKEGTAVKKGQLLAELDAQVMKESLEEVKTQLDLASNIFLKQSALWGKNIGSEIQYLQAKANKESLERRLNTLNEQLKLAQIKSPIDGMVESVPLRVGQMASPGLPTSTIRVINMNVAKISADVSETYATRIKNGNSAFVSFPDTGKEIETKLNFTSRFIDPTNRTFKIECKVSSKDVELRANMIAYVKIKDYTNEKAFCLPVNYIQSNQEGKFIYIAKQNNNEWIAEKRIIKIGMDYNGIAEVLEGINVGDKIITAGFQSLNSGEKIIF
ncbi:MAG TPA: efflux RND transporter periplasmic adaptor subunit [Bacteroidales bacterium]|nr:efflux RND transporter periplasmic adaptor subunit [Bacteroidales bacterium]